jgi:hypothetical protein
MSQAINENLSPERIVQAGEELVRVVTSPQYLEAAAEVNALPVEQRLEAVKELLSVEALRARGLEIPEGLRISPRWFEPPTAGVLSADSADSADSAESEVLAHGAAPATSTLCISVGTVLCVSYGSDLPGYAA